MSQLKPQLNVIKRLYLSVICLFLFSVIPAAPVFASQYHFDYKTLHVGEEYKKYNRSVELGLVEVTTGGYFYRVYVQNEKGRRTRITDVTPAIITDGKRIIYSRAPYQGTPGRVYSFDISSGKQKLLFKGNTYRLYACNGKYLFCGTDIPAGEYVEDSSRLQLYRYTLSSGKKKKIAGGISNLRYGDKRYVIYGSSSADSDVPIYIMNKDGSGKKKIGKGCRAAISNGRVYYARYIAGHTKIRIYSCDFKGKHMKVETTFSALTGSCPQKFRKMGLLKRY